LTAERDPAIPELNCPERRAESLTLDDVVFVHVVKATPNPSLTQPRGPGTAARLVALADDKSPIPE